MRVKLILATILSMVPSIAVAATLSVLPATNTVTTGDVFETTIQLNSEGASVAGVDLLYVNYDPTILEIQDASSTMSGVQVTPGVLMPNTPTNNVDTSLGKISFSQLATGGSPFVGSGTLATITFKALKSGTTPITIDATPNDTTDSNVASGGQDVLGSVTGATYIVNDPPVTPPPSGGGGGGGGGGGSSYYMLTLVKTGNGIGIATSSPSGINCGYTCFYSFAHNTPVYLNASSTTGSYLSSWQGCDLLIGSTCKITITANKNITANFSLGVASTSAILVGATSTINVTSTYKFTTWLILGYTNPQVKALQVVLNANGYIVSNTGFGSPGNETTYFDTKTLSALQRFQCDRLSVCYGTPITTGYGAVGPRTRQALSLLRFSVASLATTEIPIPVSGFQFMRSLAFGSTGVDVKNLQIYLNNHGYTVSSFGGGSPGHETLYFGPATKAAVIRFQIANKITPAVGFFGPITRKTINSLE